MEPNNHKQQRRKSHIKNLYLVAIADGKLDYIEEMFLFARAAGLNIKKEEVRKIMEFPDTIPFLAPNKFSNKILQMYDMLHMVLLNGTADERELSMCREIAQKLNLDPEIVNTIVKDILKRRSSESINLIQVSQYPRTVSNN